MPEFKVVGREMRIFEVKKGTGQGYIYLPKAYIGEKVAVIFGIKLDNNKKGGDEEEEKCLK